MEYISNKTLMQYLTLNEYSKISTFNLFFKRSHGLTTKLFNWTKPTPRWFEQSVLRMLFSKLMKLIDKEKYPMLKEIGIIMQELHEFKFFIVSVYVATVKNLRQKILLFWITSISMCLQSLYLDLLSGSGNVFFEAYV